MRSRTIGLLVVAVAAALPARTSLADDDPVKVLASTPATALDVCLSNLNRELSVIAESLGSDISVTAVRTGPYITISGSALPQADVHRATLLARRIANTIKQFAVSEDAKGASLPVACSPKSSQNQALALRERMLVAVNVIGEAAEHSPGALVSCRSRLSAGDLFCEDTAIDQ